MQQQPCRNARRGEAIELEGWGIWNNFDSYFRLPSLHTETTRTPRFITREENIKSDGGDRDSCKYVDPPPKRGVYLLESGLCPFLRCAIGRMSSLRVYFLILFSLSVDGCLNFGDWRQKEDTGGSAGLGPPHACRKGGRKSEEEERAE